MTNQIQAVPQDSPPAKPLENAIPSLMAVQELLGLFHLPQAHAARIQAHPDKPTTELQSALQEKPLTYV